LRVVTSSPSARRTRSQSGLATTPPGHQRHAARRPIASASASQTYAYTYTFALTFALTFAFCPLPFALT
jgi:hypothetical protein